MADRPYRPATCHPDRKLLARGMCAQCYAQARRTEREQHYAAAPDPLDVPLVPISPASLAAALKNAAPESLANALKIAAGGHMSLDEAIRKTKQELILALPEAARALRHAIASDPHRGQSVKAASILLKAFQVPIDGQLQPFLKNPLQAAPAPTGTQIVVGLHVGNGGDEEPRMGRVVGTVGPMVHPKKPNK
jgi:hypothetical protein